MFKKTRYTPVARALRIIDRFRGHRRGVVLTELAEDVQASVRTVRRDLLDIEEAGYRIEYPIRDGKMAARLEGKSYSDVPIVRRERYSLLAVRRVFDVLYGTPFYDDIKSVCDKLTERLTAAERAEFETFGDRVVYVPYGGAKVYSGKEAVLDRMLEAVMSRRVVRYSYVQAKGVKETDRLLAPYKIVIYKNGLYVVGRRLKSLAEATEPHPAQWEPAVLPLERFTEAADLPRTSFELPQGLDLETLFDGAFGILFGKSHDPVRVVIEFSKARRGLVLSRVYHPTQTIESLPDGRVRLAFDCRNLTQVVPFVLEWGPHARVVEPLRLREWIAAELQGALAHYYESAAVTGSAAA